MIVRDQVQVSGRSGLAAFDVLHETAVEPLVTFSHAGAVDLLAVIEEPRNLRQTGVRRTEGGEQVGEDGWSRTTGGRWLACGGRVPVPAG